MTQYGLVWVTAGSKEEAGAIAHSLVVAKLAASEHGLGLEQITNSPQ